MLKYEEMLNTASDICGELDRSVLRATEFVMTDKVKVFLPSRKVPRITNSRDLV